MDRRIHLLVRSLCLGLACTAAAAAAEGPRQPGGRPPPSTFPADRRLDRTVTILEPRIYLGELLPLLARQAEVPLGLEGEDNPSSGIHLSAVFRERPLREVMSGVSTLLSTPFNRWSWVRGSEKGKGYILKSEWPPAVAGQAAQREALRRWTADLVAYHRIAGLPEPERARQAATRPDLFHPSGHNRDRATLLGGMSEDGLRRLLASRGETPLDRAALSPSGQEAYDRAVASAPSPLPPGSPRPPVAFDISWTPDHLGPVLWYRVGRGKWNVVGGGGWDQEWQKGLAGDWQHRGAQEIQSLERARGARDPAAGEPMPGGTLPAWLKQAARRQGLNVLADQVYPRHYRRYQPTWLGRTPLQTVQVIVAHDHVAKKSGGLHLIRHPSALVHPRDHLVPWPVIQALRRAAEGNAGFLALPELAVLARLSPAQFVGLAEEFPNAQAEQLGPWGQVLEFRERLPIPARKKLETADGLPLEDAGLPARMTLLEPTPDPRNTRAADFLFQHGRRAVVSLLIEDVPGADGKLRQLVWTVRADGAGKRVSTLRLSPRRPLEPEWEDLPPAKKGSE